MAALHTKRYEVAIWRENPGPSVVMPDVRKEVQAVTPIGAVIAVFLSLSWFAADVVLVSALDYDVGDCLVNVRLEQGQLLWMPS